EKCVTRQRISPRFPVDRENRNGAATVQSERRSFHGFLSRRASRLLLFRRFRGRFRQECLELAEASFQFGLLRAKRFDFFAKSFGLALAYAPEIAEHLANAPPHATVEIAIESSLEGTARFRVAQFPERAHHVHAEIGIARLEHFFQRFTRFSIVRKFRQS